MRRYGWCAALAALALLAGGCVELREEIWVEGDGTVRYAKDMALPEFVLVLGEAAGSDSSRVGGMPGGLADLWKPTIGDSARTRQYLDGDMHHWVQEVDLPSLARLAELSARDRDKQGMDRDVFSGYEAVPVGANRVRLRRTMLAATLAELASGQTQDVASLSPGSPHDSMAARIFAGRVYRLTIHAPRIVSTNGALAADGRSAEWTYPMAEALADTTTVLEAVIELGR